MQGEKAILGGPSLEDAASWADDYRRDHPETGPWHCIGIPLADSQIDMARECPNGDCVIAKTERFLEVLKDRAADRAAWVKGMIEDWVLEGHQRAQRVAYGDLGSANPAIIGPAYEEQADPVIEVQLEKAGVRLASALDAALT